MTEEIYSWQAFNGSSHASGYETVEVVFVTPNQIRYRLSYSDSGEYIVEDEEDEESYGGDEVEGQEEYFSSVSGSRVEIIAGELGYSPDGEVNLARYAAEIICGDGSWLEGGGYDDGSKLGVGYDIQFSVGISEDEEEEFLALLDSDYVDAIRSPGSEPYRRRQKEIARWQAENQE